MPKASCGRASAPPWFVCQIGAREHYAIPRALHRAGRLGALITDFWVPPGSVFSRLPGGRRLRDRFHDELAGAAVHAPNARMLAFEMEQRLAKRPPWPVMIERNRLFQRRAQRYLARSSMASGSPACVTQADAGRMPALPACLFSYSYAALELFRFAKARGWTTVLGQIDPGPEEERIVAAERERYAHLASSWGPAPADYWESWREEIELADRILVNSEWSRRCLLKEGVPDEKIEVVPLVYRGRLVPPHEALGMGHGKAGKTSSQEPGLKVLFLGQVNLRKGVGRLLDAMRLLRDEAVELILAGPSEIPESAWADLPKVRWVGPVPRSEVGRYYETADLFILPTLSDGYALTQLEAMSHGLPVMASKCCGEAVTDGVNGMILDDLEPESIAAALRRATTMAFPDVRPPEFGLDDLAKRLGRE